MKSYEELKLPIPAKKQAVKKQPKINRLVLQAAWTNLIQEKLTMKQVAPLRYGVIFKKAFCDPIVFVKDILNVEQHGL